MALTPPNGTVFAVFYNNKGEAIDVQRVDGSKAEKKRGSKEDLSNNPLNLDNINGMETTTILFKKGHSPCWVRDSFGNWYYIC